MVRVALNCAILGRGFSGSASAARHIGDSFRRSTLLDLQVVFPSRRLRTSRMWNAGAQAHWDLIGAARQAAGAQVLVSPCNVGRARGRQGHLLVIHDTMVLDYASSYDRGYAAYAKALFGYSVARADRIVTPSAFAAQCVAERWPRAPVPTVARWPVEPRTGSRRDLPTDHTVLMVGATDVHKRHSLGVEAVHLLRERTGTDVKLHLIGPQGNAEAALRPLLARHAAWFERRTNLTGEELAEAYRDAWCLLQPSLAEGYGLPVAEAAAWALPAVHSGNAALPEIAPGAVAREAAAESYADGMQALLAGGAYKRASRAALAAAQDLSPQSFDAAFHDVVKSLANV